MNIMVRQMSVVKKYKVEVVKQRFSQIQGEQFTFKNRIGTMIEFDDGKVKLELDMFPSLEIEITPVPYVDSINRKKI